MVDLVGSFKALLRAVERVWGVVGNDSWPISSGMARRAPEIVRTPQEL